MATGVEDSNDLCLPNESRLPRWPAGGADLNMNLYAAFHS